MKWKWAFWHQIFGFRATIPHYNPKEGLLMSSLWWTVFGVAWFKSTSPGNLGKVNGNMNFMKTQMVSWTNQLRLWHYFSYLILTAMTSKGVAIQEQGPRKLEDLEKLSKEWPKMLISQLHGMSQERPEENCILGKRISLQSTNCRDVNNCGTCFW